jgi:tRNA(Ile)-lysidine synthase
MNLVHEFQHFISRYQFQKTNVLLAVSGGIDSTVLCQLSRQAGLSFAIAHCNFNLRGEESERDEAFVQSLSNKYGVEFFVKKFDTTAYAAENKQSIQEAARTLRYQWFDEVRNANGFAYTLLAHHADDNIETLLINFFRGTGLEGLSGMPVEKAEAHCLRPMLGIRRKDIEAFAKEENLSWIEDSSNTSSKYTRNFFRNELIPQLRSIYPQVEENLLRNIERFGQATHLYSQCVDELKKKVCEVRGEEVHIPVRKLLKYKHTSLIYEIIKDYGFGEGAVGEVLKLAEAESGKYIAADRYRIIRHRRWFIIAPKTVTAQMFVIEKGDSLLHFDEWQLSVKRVNQQGVLLNTSPAVAQLDAHEIEYPLLLRKWKAGDYFYPLGMKKKKKLARFFIDQKLSKTEKEKVWVLESHKRIVWVVGHRIDDRFQLTAKTTEVLLLAQKR